MRGILLIISTLIPLLMFPMSAGAIQIVNLTPHEEGLTGRSWVAIDWINPQSVEFELGLAGDSLADIRGFFFDIENNAKINKIIVTSLADANNYFTPLNVITGSSLSGWPSVSGSADMQGAGEFDFGIEFGLPGIGKKQGDIRAITFSILSDSPIIIGSDFGMRLMSFGEYRNDSRKMINPPEMVPNPEPATMILFGVGIISLAQFARKKLNK